MNYVFAPAPTVAAAVHGSADQFPVHRIYCVGRNYEDHAKEMGYTGREPPFFFLKPADALVNVAPGETGEISYPSLTTNFHHEVELVIAIGHGGKNIPATRALEHVWGYALGLDMTRRDLQTEMKKAGRPWCIGKGFDESAPMGPIVRAADVPHIAQAELSLTVNGEPRQKSNVAKLIWNIAEIIEHLSTAWTLQSGDLIFTGTPEGVGAVKSGDVMHATLAGLPDLTVKVR
jgi:fumarylpyruvate hydrolase